MEQYSTIRSIQATALDFIVPMGNQQTVNKPVLKIVCYSRGRIETPGFIQYYHYSYRSAGTAPESEVHHV